ncbi:MAG: hypothetical protein WBN09_06070 [Woeseiaceae bacterium]
MRISRVIQYAFALFVTKFIIGLAIGQAVDQWDPTKVAIANNAIGAGIAIVFFTYSSFKRAQGAYIFAFAVSILSESIGILLLVASVNNAAWVPDFLIYRIPAIAISVVLGVLIGKSLAERSRFE